MACIEGKDTKEALPKEISGMSFEDLLKLQNEIGSKEYNSLLFGIPTKKFDASNFKRANKNRPREMSSKKPIKLVVPSNQTKPQTPRDPRFDPLCGSYNDAIFKSNYKFVEKIKLKERAQLAKEYNEEKDLHNKAKIKLLIQRIDNQFRESAKHEMERKHKNEETRVIKTSLIRGEKPVFKKKSVQRVEALVHKYEELKKNNKLQKHFEKKYKKLAKKDKHTMKNMDL